MLGFQGPQKAADVARVEVEARAKGADVGAGGADLEEEAGLAQGAATAEVAGFERTGALGDQAVEATDLLDVVGVQSLTLVREWRVRQR